MSNRRKRNNVSSQNILHIHTYMPHCQFYCQEPLYTVLLAHDTALADWKTGNSTLNMFVIKN